MDEELINLDLAAFAAQRSKEQDTGIDALRSPISEWLDDFTDTSKRNAVRDAIVDEWKKAFNEHTRNAGYGSALRNFTKSVDDALKKTSDPTGDHTLQVERIATWAAVYAINSGTSAGFAATGGTSMRWTTMHDDAVRDTHRAADGKTAAVGGTYDIGGYKLHYPGEPVGPPEVWINCRCTLAPSGRKRGRMGNENTTMGSVLITQPNVTTTATTGANYQINYTPIQAPVRNDLPDDPDADYEPGEDEPLVDDTDDLMEIPVHGVAAPQGVPTGDGRQFGIGSLTSRPLPLPIAYQTMTGGGGHDNSVTVGRIDELWNDPATNEYRYRGVILTTKPHANAVLEGIMDGSGRGVSVDCDNVVAEMSDGNDEGPVTFSSARVAGLTVVSIPAFHEAYIALGHAFEDELTLEDHAALAACGCAGEEFASGATPPDGARKEAKRGIDWVNDGHGGSGLESATITRAHKIAAGEELTHDHISRMHSFFSRHQHDSDGKGWSPGEDGYPSAGRVAHALWGGDAGKSFAASHMAAQEAGDTEDFRDVSTDERNRRAQDGTAMPDGSFPIANVSDLKNAIQAIGRAKDPAKAKAHIKKRARALGHPELIPDGWAAEVETFAPGTHDGPGWITNPRATSRIRRYWVRGKGALKIRWGVPGDFNRCRKQLVKYVQNPDWLAGLCANMHKEAIGVWPGQEDGGRGRHALAASGEPAPMFTLVAAAGPRSNARAEFYADPKLTGPTALEVDLETGRVWGHLATWGVCHIGIPGVCTTAPHNYTQYRYFRTGAVHTDQGKIAVGHLTLATGHASMKASARAALEHYDNTGSVVADVAAGEDQFGIWVAGELRDGVTEAEARTLAAGALSGDWREMNGALELVGALCVNVPGFPIPRNALAASAGEQTALVAAGIVTHDDPVHTFSSDTVAAIARASAREVLAEQKRAERLAALRPARDDARRDRIERARARVTEE